MSEKFCELSYEVHSQNDLQQIKAKINHDLLFFLIREIFSCLIFLDAKVYFLLFETAVPHLTPNAFQYSASINTITHQYWIIDWLMSLFYLSDLRSVWFYKDQT